MAQFNYTKFLKEGSIEKYLMEADFGNDPQDRYDYVRPLMSRLPDTPRTEYLIDALEDALEDFKMTDDMTEKMEFDNIFIEIMKELGLENELREMNDPVTKMMKEPLGAPSGNPYAEESTMTDEEFEAIFGKNPEADEIGDEDLEAAADYFDNLEENDKTLDEIIGEGKFKVGDTVHLKADTKKTKPMKITKIRKMSGTGEMGYTVDGKNEYSGNQLVKGMSSTEKANVFVRENKVLDASNALESAINSAADELSDEQIDTITNMILDLRDKVKAQLKKKK